MQVNPKTLTILGSTGSIGTFTLDIIRHYPAQFKVEVLVAQKNTQKLLEQIREFKPKFVAITDTSSYTILKEALTGLNIKILAGPEAAVEAAAYPTDWVMSSIVGVAGLKPTMKAIERGTVVALANKESLVCAGSLMMKAVQDCKATLLPTDSEHNAIFQLFNPSEKKHITKVTLTASGGPFREWTKDQMKNVSAEIACRHPNWSMGAKISIDSATLMNKGLELIEASHLFGLEEDRLDVLIHPQSIVHGIICFEDGSHLLQLAQTDMRIPISYNLAWPARLKPPLDFKSSLAVLSGLQFELPDETRFPSLKLARNVLKIGKNAPTILNAANEVAVSAFTEGKIGFLDIYKIVEKTIEQSNILEVRTIEDVLEEDQKAREKAAELLHH